MSKVFLETSALVEYSFRDKRTKQSIAVLFPPEAKVITSRYVIFEIARGYLRNLILLYNKASELEGFSELFIYARNSFRASHRLGTILTCFEDYFRAELKASDFGFEGMPQDVAQLKLFRGHLGKLIRRGWRRLTSDVDMIINNVGCREIVEAPYIDGNKYYQELGKDRCGIAGACGLKKYISNFKAEFQSLKVVLEIENGDTETRNRVKALRELFRVDNRNFDSDNCYKSGDAIIAHESPNDCILISKNGMHLGPICNHFRKPSNFY